jgi:hypothetical protein
MFFCMFAIDIILLLSQIVDVSCISVPQATPMARVGVEGASKEMTRTGSVNPTPVADRRKLVTRPIEPIAAIDASCTSLVALYIVDHLPGIAGNPSNETTAIEH